MADRTCDVTDCDRKHVARGLCAMHWKREYGNRTRYPRTCDTCRVEFLSSREDGRFCSDDCKGLAYRKSRDLVGPVLRDCCDLPLRHPARRQQPPPRLWFAGTCAWCLASFVDNQPAARFCSKRCGKMASKARRGRFVIQLHRRLAIYERDAWTCQLCLDPVDSSLLTLDPYCDWAPSLDHIECQSWALIPDHSDANLRLAHRWCNAVRSDGRRSTENDLRISHVA